MRCPFRYGKKAMIETLTTMVSLILSAGAAGVIGHAMWEDRQSLRRALACPGGVSRTLPPHTHQVAGPRRARFITVRTASEPLRVAA